MKKSKPGIVKTECQENLVSPGSEWNGEQSDQDSDEEINRELVIYEEIPEDRMPKLVDLVPREIGVAEGNREAEGVMELGRGIDPAPNSDSVMSQPRIPVLVDSDSDPEFLDPEAVTDVHDPVVLHPQVLDPKSVVALDQDNEGAGSLESGEEIVESSESESVSEEDGEDSEESPVLRKSTRARTRKKVFSYDTKGQPVWEETAKK